MNRVAFGSWSRCLVPATPATALILAVITAGCGSSDNASDIRHFDSNGVDSVGPDAAGPDLLRDSNSQPDQGFQDAETASDSGYKDLPDGTVPDDTTSDSGEITVCPCDPEIKEICISENMWLPNFWCGRCGLCASSSNCLGCGGTYDCDTSPILVARYLYQRSPCCPDCDELPPEPVCGSNGTVYANVCAMACAKVSWCAADGPIICGSDGITYPNACRARCAGTDTLHEGPCK